MIQSASPLPGAEVGENYKHLLQARGGTEPYRWEITAGKPDWLSLDRNGVLEGKPTKAETDIFAVQVSDSGGTTQKKEFSLTVKRKGAEQEAPVDAAKKASPEKPPAESESGKSAPAPEPAKKASPEKPPAGSESGKSAPEPAAASGTDQVAEKPKTEPRIQSPALEPAGTTPAGAVPSLKDIFDLDRYPIALLVAAVFGLTPGLLFDRLLQQAERYKTNLTSSQATGEVSQKAPKP
jgi:hypothetical protein